MATMTTTASAGAAVAHPADFHEASDDDMPQPAANNDTLLSYDHPPPPPPHSTWPSAQFPPLCWVPYAGLKMQWRRERQRSRVRMMMGRIRTPTVRRRRRWVRWGVWVRRGARVRAVPRQHQQLPAHTAHRSSPACLPFPLRLFSASPAPHDMPLRQTLTAQDKTGQARCTKVCVTELIGVL